MFSSILGNNQSTDGTEQSKYYTIIYPQKSSSTIQHNIHPDDFCTNFIKELAPPGSTVVALKEQVENGLTMQLPLTGSYNYKLGSTYIAVYKEYFEKLDLSMKYKPQTSKKPIFNKVPKISILGDIGCGKTSLVKKISEDEFNSTYFPTIGVNVTPVNLSDTKSVNLWDISGVSRFHDMLSDYLVKSDIIFVLFDMTRHSTYEAAYKWKQHVIEYAKQSGESIPLMILIGSKADISPVKDTYSNSTILSDFEKDASGKPFDKYFVVSTKTGNGIDDLLDYIGDTFVLDNDVNL